MKKSMMFVVWCLVLSVLLCTAKALAMTNSEIKNQALTYVGQHGGQCKPFVQKVISDLGGVLGSGYRQCYLAIGTEIANQNDVTAGDIIQISKDSDPETFFTGMHSAIVVENYFNGRFKIVSSNYCSNQKPDCEKVSVNDWNPFNDAAKYNLQVHFYRLGTTDAPYTYSAHAYTGSGEVQGGADTNYNYSLPIRKSQFTIGETAKAMVRVENISVRHKWLAEIWRSGVKQSDYAWSWNEVGAGWNASYFWPEYKANSAGNYQFKIYLYLGDDNSRDHIVNLDFTVIKPVDWQPYAYDGNGYTGYGPPDGEADTNWNYSLPRETTVFSEGDHVYGMIRINDVYVNHRFKVKAYRDNRFMYEYKWNLNDVNGDRWNTSYFWPELNNASAGNWEFKVYLEYDGKTVLLGVLPFTVSRPVGWQPYVYDGNGYTGHGPVQGGESSNWRYWLSDKTKEVNEGDTLYGMLRLDKVKVDHRFKVETYRNGVKKWEWAMPDFNLVGSGWDYAHFYFGFEKVWPGDWRFDVLINTASDSRNSWQLIDSLDFTVNKKSQPPGVRYDFNNHNPEGWTIGYDVFNTEQNQADKNTWMVVAEGSNPGVMSPELPSGFTTTATPNLRFSVKIRGNVRNTYGQIWLMDNTGYWGYRSLIPRSD